MNLKCAYLKSKKVISHEILNVSFYYLDRLFMTQIL